MPLVTARIEHMFEQVLAETAVVGAGRVRDWVDELAGVDGRGTDGRGTDGQGMTVRAATSSASRRSVRSRS